MDSYQYPTLKFLWRKYLPRVLSISTWLRFLQRILGKHINLEQNVNDADNGIFVMEEMPKSRFATDLRTLIERGTALFYIYAGGWLYNYREQFADAFHNVDFQDCVSVEYFEHADHLYTLLEDRETMMQSICRWMQQQYTNNTPTGTAA